MRNLIKIQRNVSKLSAKTRGKDNIFRGKPSSSFKEMHQKPNLNVCIQIIILSRVLGDHWANATGEEMDLNPHNSNPEPAPEQD